MMPAPPRLWRPKMPKLRKREVRKAIARAKDMLARNADPCEVFEGVLNRGYTRALRTFVVLGENFLAGRTSEARRIT